MNTALETDPKVHSSAAPAGAGTKPLSVVRLREILSAYYDRSTGLAVLLLLADLGLFAFGQYLLLASTALGWELLGGALTTLAIIRLFIIGHDACHGSLTDSATLNKVLGRIAFMSSLTPFSLWRVGHNVVHHGFNNLKGRDFVWEPLAPAEFMSLSPARRALERVYRSAFGPLPYYLVEIWWKKLYYPNRANAPGGRREFFWDSTLVTVFAAAWIGWLTVIGLATGGAAHVAFVLTVGFLLPFLIWNWTIGFVIYLHHTHPDVVWYADKSAWLKAQGMLHGTVRYHVRPVWNLLLHNIMEHAAHHLDAKIPMYRLKAAQAALARLVPDIPVVELSFRTYWRSVRECKLFDFERRVWVTFPTVSRGKA
jgi:omega-6 fatty acid desaturase (delta-12 desaturase)